MKAEDYYRLNLYYKKTQVFLQLLAIALILANIVLVYTLRR